MGKSEKEDIEKQKAAASLLVISGAAAAHSPQNRLESDRKELANKLVDFYASKAGRVLTKPQCFGLGPQLGGPLILRVVTFGQIDFKKCLIFDILGPICSNFWSKIFLSFV